MTQAEGLLETLRALQAAGWPLEVHGKDEPGSSAIVALDGKTGVAIQRGYLDVRNAALLRDWLEQEVERRGLWRGYLAALVDGRDERARYEEGYSWYVLSQCRPTLLEVARAVLRVAKEGENA
ncbi:hypothetical protein [Meiothermus phage MMP17]|nr:hypothetical protein [Meiothermus phage MMP7]QAY18081.1 hypothetical protein [Meiothermus phage MMP17]